MLLADTKVKWEQLSPDKETYFLTGTDEHGLKIQAAAENKGVEPKRFVDSVSQNFKHLVAHYDVQPQRFIRTTDADHIDAVVHFWNHMMARGLIYKGSHSGWYSVSDEAFYPESQIKEIVDPVTQAAKKVSIETNNEVVFHEEENYFFRLAQFQADLVAHLEQNPQFVQPAIKQREVLEILKKDTLEDLSVSRPSSRLKWGITVPNDASQKVYVWFDALINYLTAAGYPALDGGIWPADCHIVGKDIMRFHCIYWPIFLMAAGLPLPKQVVVHSHWLSEGVKMSKSLGNVVDPIELANHYGKDSARFFLMANANLVQDCKFTELAMHQTHSMLINKYANTCARIGQGTKFDISEAVGRFHKGAFEHCEELILENALGHSPQQFVTLWRDLVSSINSLHADMDSEMALYGQQRAIQRWWETIEKGNIFYQFCEPWRYLTMAQDAALSAEERRAYETIKSLIVFTFAEMGRVSSICISPFMPTLALGFLDRWGVSENHRDASFCKYGGEHSYGNATFAAKEKLMQKVKPRK